VLKGLEPVPDSATPRTATPATAATSPVTAITTLEQAQTELAARGVLWQRWDASGDTGEWKFTCSVPNPKNPNLHRTHEARARDQLTAVRVVLEQIDRERQ
jgi:hypothetical protein